MHVGKHGAHIERPLCISILKGHKGRIRYTWIALIIIVGCPLFWYSYHLFTFCVVVNLTRNYQMLYTESGGWAIRKPLGHGADLEWVEGTTKITKVGPHEYKVESYGDQLINKMVGPYVDGFRVYD